MPKTDSLELSVWEYAPEPSATLPITRFQLGAAAQATLAHWCREQTKRPADALITVVLRGLSEVMAWFVPDIGFIRHDRDAGGGPSQRLSLYFVGDRRQDARLRRGVQAGLQAWVNVLYPDRPPEMRQQIAACAQDGEAWSLIDVGCALKADSRACPSPEHWLFWDALAAHAADRLQGRLLQYGSGERRILARKTTQGSAFEGVELVAYPPKQGDRGGLWTEVVTLHTPTYPERKRIHLLARASIRNWGPVTRPAAWDGPDRSLDVFFPAEGLDGEARLRHTTFAFQAREEASRAEGGRPTVKAVWPHKEEQQVLDLLRRFAGRASLAPEEVGAPVIDEAGLWILPRLGAVHGDDRLPGASGMAWPDRRDITASLDEPLAAAGLTRAEPMRRAKHSLKLDTPFAGGADAKTWPRKRAAVRAALHANGCGDELSLYVLHRLDDTPARVRRLLGKLLGPPDSQDETLLRWADGLAVRIIAASAGPLAEQLPQANITPEDEAGKTAGMLAALKRLKRQEAAAAAEARMSEHLASLRPEPATVACGLLEMPESHRGARGDPFQLARRELARYGVLPQVVLVPGAATRPVKEPDPEEADHRYLSALSDLLRMLGVLPTEPLPRTFAPAALTIVQRNGDWVGGSFRPGQALALAARVKDGRLEAAVPNEAGLPVWAPYARTALRVLCGDYEKFGRNRQAETRARYETFFAAALTEIDRSGPALVLAEGESLRHKLDTFLNSDMTFDSLAFGVQLMTRADLPNVRLVRLSPDRNRQPYYFQDLSQWPSGLFGWGEATRTFYGLKSKPPTIATKSSKVALISRHAAEGENKNPPQPGVARVSSQLDELCVQFMQAGDDPLELAYLAHKLRGAHAQTKVQTTQPFPLHELRMLGGGIML